ncbi:hypothetical protein B0H13DRAFT_2656053 [Mycena leptocephala]|nr:hypothetical protein B0H13DRAFT_2656053 [Mycena leptocephala]
MDAFTTIFSAVAYISFSPAPQPTSAAVEELPQIDTVDYDRGTGSSGGCIIYHHTSYQAIQVILRTTPTPTHIPPITYPTIISLVFEIISFMTWNSYFMAHNGITSLSSHI